MGEPLPRRARVVLLTPDGAVPGALPIFEVATPWWQDVGPVVGAAREAHGIDITLLRVLDVAVRSKTVLVTYLAETVQPPTALEPWDGELDEQPFRNPYARPGGPQADVAWAESVLAAHGLALSGPPEQVRTWNLSSLWRLPTAGQNVWLKAVPAFFAHEGALIAALAGERVPRLLGQDGNRILMAEAPGDDLYTASREQLLLMVELLVDLQAKWIGRTDELLALGLPDWRDPALSAQITEVFERHAHELSTKDRGALNAFIAGLPSRFTGLAACGLPDTLVHGDFHPGNLRGTDLELTLLDWGDSGVGHPLLDGAAFLSRIPAEAVEEVRTHWAAHWRATIPGADPERAMALLAPIAAVRQAVIYRGFLDRIEPAEHPYHAADPLDWLQRAATLLRRSH